MSQWANFVCCQHKICLSCSICYWSRHGTLYADTTHRGAECPEELPSGDSLILLVLECVCYMCNKGCADDHPCISYVFLLTNYRGTQYCTSFLSFNFWIFNACLNTGVLSHPMNVCKYEDVYMAAYTRKHTRLLINYLSLSLWIFLV